MADNRYYGGITVGAAGFEIGAQAPVDSRFRVKNTEGLNELLTYEGLVSYVEANQTYYQFIDGAWKALSVNSAAELEEIIKGLIATETTGAMEFKGATAALPENPGKGDMWKVAGENINIVIDEKTAKVGDTIIYNGEAWILIPSGDDIEDTWRKVIAGGNELASDEALELIAGENVTITEEGGKVTISSSYEDTHYESKLVVGNEATDSADENVVENGNVRLNLVEDGVVKSSHKIVGAGGITVTHATGEEGNVITIEAPEGAKYDLAAKTENGETILSLAGTDNTEDKVAIVGNDAVSVSTVDGKVQVSAHDTKYTGSEGNGIKVTVVDDGAISAEIEANAVTTEKIADKNVTLAKLEESVQTKLGYIDTEKNVSEAISEAIEELNLADTYVEEEGFETRVKGIKVTNAENADKADEATHATNADNATNAANAQEAAHATNADEAIHAANADEAAHAENADAATHANAAGKVDNAITIKVGGVDVVFDGSEVKTADVDAAIEAAIDAIPEPVDYTITCADTDYDATESAPAFKRHTLTQNGKQVCVIDVPRDLVLKSGYVDAEKDELVLVLVNDEEVRVDVKHLIEYVTGGTATDGMITVTVDDNFVATATINDGTITEAKLHTDVTAKLNKTWEEVGVAKGLVDALAGEGNTTTVAAIDTRVGVLENAGHLTEITTTANNGLKVTNKNNIDIDTDVVFVLDCNW